MMRHRDPVENLRYAHRTGGLSTCEQRVIHRGVRRGLTANEVIELYGVSLRCSYAWEHLVVEASFPFRINMMRALFESHDAWETMGRVREAWLARMRQRAVEGWHE